MAVISRQYAREMNERFGYLALDGPHLEMWPQLGTVTQERGDLAAAEGAGYRRSLQIDEALGDAGDADGVWPARSAGEPTATSPRR